MCAGNCLGLDADVPGLLRDSVGRDCTCWQALAPAAAVAFALQLGFTDTQQLGVQRDCSSGWQLAAELRVSTSATHDVWRGVCLQGLFWFAALTL